MTVRAAWLLPGGTAQGQTREDTRLAPVGTWSPESEIRTRDGVVPGGTPFAASDAGAMSLQVGIGRAVVQGTDAQGAYPVAVDAPETLTFADGAALFDRIDTVVLRVFDGLFDVHGQTLARVEIVQGTAAETPTAPVLEPACLPLWDVTVPAGTSAGVGGIDWTSALTDRRRFTAAVGGIIPQGGGLAFDGVYDGQYRDADGVLERWSVADAEWQVYPPAPTPPAVSNQVSMPSSWAVATFTDFPAVNWAPLTVTVPPSGAVRITVSAACLNTNTSTSTAWAGWRASGALVESTTEKTAVATAGSRTYASRVTIRTGLTPGTALTVTPQYNVSSVGTGSQTRVSDGQLTVEMIP